MKVTDAAEVSKAALAARQGPQRKDLRTAFPEAADPGDREALREIGNAVRGALEIDRLLDRRIRVEIERDLHMIVVKIVDGESGEVVRQIPLPEALAASRRIREFLERREHDGRGIVLSEEA